MKIGIIGSGPVGAAAALTFLKAGYNVQLFDLGFESNSTMDLLVRGDENKISGLKQVNGQIYPYDFNEYNIIDESSGERNWFTSKALGGFSTIWGATWSPFEELTSSDWKLAFEKANEMIFSNLSSSNSSNTPISQIRVSAICSCFSFVQPDEFTTPVQRGFAWDVRASESSLAVYGKACISCGLCQSGCPTNAIWTSKELIKSCGSFPGFKLETNCYVKTFSERSEMVLLNTSIGDFQVDSVFIACGPVASSALIMRSVQCLEPLTLSDTRMITMPFLRIKSSDSHAGAFSLSGREFKFQLKERGGLRLHVQLYAHVNEFSSRVKSQFPAILHKLVEFLLKRLESRIFVGLIYVDDQISGSLKLSLGGALLAEEVDQNLLARNMKKLKSAISIFRSQYGLWPIWPFAKIGAIGDSYHLGALGGVDISVNGQLNCSDKVYVIGAAGLKEIEPGPITMTAMAHAIKTSQNYIKQLPKF